MIIIYYAIIWTFADVAEEILNKCTVSDPRYKNPDDEFYSVVFNYEFVEDARDDEEGYVRLCSSSKIPIQNVVRLLRILKDT